jgi:hypothetical protein
VASIAESIESIFLAHTKNIEGIKTVKYFEPDAVDRVSLPMLCMFFMLPEGVEAATGVVEDVSYAWEISIYVSLADFKDAQAKIRDLSQLVVANFRQHRDDYDLFPDGDVFARSLKRRNPPTPDESGTYLRASWELLVTVGEQ